MLSKRKRYAMLFLIFTVFFLIPFKMNFLHYWHLSIDFGMKQYKNMVINMDSMLRN